MFQSFVCWRAERTPFLWCSDGDAPPVEADQLTVELSNSRSNRRRSVQPRRDGGPIELSGGVKRCSFDLHRILVDSDIAIALIASRPAVDPTGHCRRSSSARCRRRIWTVGVALRSG